MYRFSVTQPNVTLGVLIRVVMIPATGQAGDRGDKMSSECYTNAEMMNIQETITLEIQIKLRGGK